MQKFLFLFLTLVCSAVFSQEEADFNYKATYQLTFQPDSTNTASKKTEEMFLYLGDNISKFSSAGKAIKDSLMANRDKSNKSMAAFARMRAQTPETEFYYIIYKGIPEGKISFTEEIVKDNFKYSQDKTLFNWEIYPETKEILGYATQKATTEFAGRNYTAWFTSEIPISEGPYKFNGLPGLIVKIADDKNHYVFELTKFQKLKNPISITFQEGDYITTTQAKLLEVKEEYNQDPFAAMERAGITFGFKPGQKERLEEERKKQLKKENNPLELEK